MEILLWLVPAAVVTVVAMAWVAWWGREGRGVVDRETAARRLGDALSKEPRRRPGYAVPPRAAEPASGVAVRRTRPTPVPPPVVEAPVEPVEPVESDADESRQAS